MVRTYHCGNVSSQRICRLLQVLHPFRDLVWLRLEGPPPGPAIEEDVVKGFSERGWVNRTILGCEDVRAIVAA